MGAARRRCVCLEVLCGVQCIYAVHVAARSGWNCGSRGLHDCTSPHVCACAIAGMEGEWRRVGGAPWRWCNQRQGEKHDACT